MGKDVSKMSLTAYEEHFAKEIVLNVINKYIKAKSFDTLNCMFSEKRVAQILSPDFPSKDILDKLVVEYKYNIRSPSVGIMGTEGRITSVLHNMRRIFHGEENKK